MALCILIGYLLACGAIYWDSQRHRRNYRGRHH
jgi:hypothetical protein